MSDREEPQAAPIHIGTSGWHYAHWKGPFYPRDLPDEEMLAYYARHLRTVEINNTFYRLPAQETLARWHKTVPEGFLFAVKASRYITHMKKLGDPAPALVLLDRVSTLGDALGPILFQLPPHWHGDARRLCAFLQTLPAGYRYAFEFRDASWYTEEIYAVLQDHGAAFCIHDYHGVESPQKVVGDWVYVRLHGPWGAYEGEYTVQQLASWAEALLAWAKQGKECYLYFNNDMAGYAAQEAQKLQAMTTNL
ncbi:MAG: DUF72 domain-containing protein [Chloroflexi bacterium]|nr:DUF72 domain-containing protein [Chloroflexota bacterium]